MKIIIEVQVDRVEGRNLSAEQVGDYICEKIMAGDLPSEPGNIWVDEYAGHGTRYRVVSAHRA